MKTFLSHLAGVVLALALSGASAFLTVPASITLFPPWDNMKPGLPSVLPGLAMALAFGGYYGWRISKHLRSV